MSASAGPLLNGILPTTVQPFNEALEYEKILRIRDEVFSGSHPRLTVPAHALRVPASQTPSALSQSQLNVPPPFPPSASPNRLAAATSQPKREEESTQAQTKPNGVPVTSSQPASNVSEFDPVLLTKSDDLVRAETQLRRQRLEKALKEQFEHKRSDARRKPAPSEAKPDFDLAAIFARVTDSAKSQSSKEDGDASDSFDEDTFYSSKAPDSTPDGPLSNSADDADEVEADEPSGLRVQSAVMGAPLYHEAEGDIPTNASPAAADPTKPSHPVDTGAMDLDDDEEEGEYSPPEATVQYPTPIAGNSQSIQDSRDPRSRPLRRYSELEDNGKRPVSPSEAQMRIVRNQITSPIAPRPSRVSPLAVAKDGPFSQNARLRRPQRIGRPGSPPSPDENQAFHPKKKRRIEKRNEKKARRNGGLSPDTFIKEENVSPPPFHDVQPLGSGRLRPSGADRPIVIDDEPVQEVRYMPAPERYVESPSRPLPRQVEQLMPLSEPRTSSRASFRPVRDDQDLRRVASMHSMRAEAPREYADPYYESPTQQRAISYARMGSPAIVESARSARETAVEYDRPPEARVVRTPAPVYREVYDDGEPTYRYAAEPMPPPPPIERERIIVDQYGRRFREIIQERPSVMPRAMPIRRGEVDPSYENHRPARAGSVFVDAAAERAYASEMPPPQVSYRRIAEQAHSSDMPGAATREYMGPGPSLRSSSVQVMDRPPRQTMYADDRPEFREPVRMGSVRPPVVRYEEPQPMEMLSRGQSARAVAREGSIFADDRRAVGPEYVPAQHPRYRAAEPQEKRYFDAEGREIIQLDGGMDGRPRVMERY